MKIVEDKLYLSYILLGSLYFISKLIFYVFDLVFARGVILGLIATILTISIGMFAFKERKEKSKPVAHWMAIIFPLIILIYTPLYMTIHLGMTIFQFPIEKLSILLIFECLGITQIILMFTCLSRSK